MAEDLHDLHNLSQEQLRDLTERIDERLSRLRQHTACGTEGPFDFDCQVLDVGDVEDVCMRYLLAMIPYTRKQDVSYLAFIDKGEHPMTGAILLAGALCLKSRLSYTIIYPYKKIEAERVKCPGLLDPVGTFDGESGILITDHVDDDNEIIPACEALRQRGGLLRAVITYSANRGLAEILRKDYLAPHEIDFISFMDTPYLMSATQKQTI